MKIFIFAILFVIVAPFTSCKRPTPHYGKVTHLTANFNGERQILEVTAYVMADDNITAAVPVWERNVQARLLAADKMNILDSFKAELKLEHGSISDILSFTKK